MVVAISDRQWRSLVDAIGLADAITTAAAALGHRLDDEVGRWHARELITACLRPWFAARRLDEVAAALSADRGVLWGPYRDWAQMMAEDRRVSEANPMFGRVEHPGYGRFLTTASPIDFARSPRRAPGLAPRLGEHTDAVLGELLGLSPDERATLRERRIVGGDAG
jgi:2-methylfumaryl-CoA isomerase